MVDILQPDPHNSECWVEHSVSNLWNFLLTKCVQESFKHIIFATLSPHAWWKNTGLDSNHGWRSAYMACLSFLLEFPWKFIPRSLRNHQMGLQQERRIGRNSVTLMSTLTLCYHTLETNLLSYSDASLCSRQTFYPLNLLYTQKTPVPALEAGQQRILV